LARCGPEKRFDARALARFNARTIALQWGRFQYAEALT
jgi:hypothetical protein